MQSGLLEYDETVPDCYVANIRLEEEVQRLRLDLDQRSAEASKAVSTAETVAKERDFHRISHRRVKDEKRELQAALARFEAEAAELREKLATTEARCERAPSHTCSFVQSHHDQSPDLLVCWCKCCFVFLCVHINTHLTHTCSSLMRPATLFPLLLLLNGSPPQVGKGFASESNSSDWIGAIATGVCRKRRCDARKGK